MSDSLSIIIVNYNSIELIKNCIASVYQFTNNLDFEILVVDNSDSKKDEILHDFPHVRWVQMNYNAGFARANNEGIRQAKAEVILLMNPDTLVQDNAIELCFKRFVSSSYPGCGVQLLNPDGTPQISGNFFITGGVNNLLPLPFFGKLLKWLGTTLKVKKTNVPEAEGEQEVDWVNGAFLMVKKAAIEKAGLLDEDFFLYAEEIEWCSRLRKQGPLCIYGDLHIIHLQGETANETFGSSGKGYYNLFDKKGRQILLSNFVRIRKQYGVLWFLFHLLIYVIEIPFFLCIVLIQTIIGTKVRYNGTHFFGYVRNLFFLLSQALTIIKNKPHFYKA
jgi:GT2 family glycosyltransferase